MWNYIKVKFTQIIIMANNSMVLTLWQVLFKYFTCSNSFDTCKSPTRNVVLSSTLSSSFCRWGNWGTEQSSMLSKLTHVKWQRQDLSPGLLASWSTCSRAPRGCLSSVCSQTRSSGCTPRATANTPWRSKPRLGGWSPRATGLQDAELRFVQACLTSKPVFD